MRLKAGETAAQELFEGLNFVSEVRTDGETAFLYVSDGAKALPALFDLLKERHVELDTITLSEPSLDDVFLKKTGRSLRDTGKEASK